MSNKFQFTPLCERLQYLHMAEYRSHFYFNSRLSARGYYRQLNPNLGNCISIHASLREATVVPHKGPALYSISIHASLREATLSCLSFPSSFLFQFTPLCERLRATSDEASVLMNISIHASLREATWFSSAVISSTSISIHASLREATHILEIHVYISDISIHASLREATMDVLLQSQQFLYFNSRLSARGYGRKIE